MVVRQTPGESEENGKHFLGYGPSGEQWESCPPAPLIGKTGWLLEKEYLPKAGLSREDCSFSNVIRCRWNMSNELPSISDSVVQQAISHCQRAHLRIPESTKLIVAGGEYAVWAFTGEAEDVTGRTLSSWRGWLLPCNGDPSRYYAPKTGDIPVFVTYHEAYLFRNPAESTAAASDWNRIGRFLAGTWPEPMPIMRTLPPLILPREFAFDTEYVPKTGYLLRFSIATRENGEPKVYVVERGHHRLRVPAGSKPIVWVHNGYKSQDLEHLSHLVGRPWHETFEVRDTMAAAHSLWSELEHTLDYIGSIYARTNYWKPLEHSSPIVYSGGDALGTYDAAQRLMAELARDPGATRKFKQLMGMLPLIQAARQVGYRVNTPRVAEVVDLLQAKKTDATLAAQAATGWPINVGSVPQIVQQVYTIEESHLNPVSGRLRLRGR
jgi:uracil-DNA glycosylase family 4